MSFGTALTGLNAASADLDVTSNNIANAGTVGFKYSRAEFADIFAASSTGTAQNAVGQGVRLSNVAQQFTQGTITATGNSLDLAIDGNGFFEVRGEGEQSFYTRAGNFSLNRDYQIVDNAGRELMGYGPNGAYTALSVSTKNMAAKATENVGVTANISSATEVGESFSTSTTVYDSQGGEHVFSLTFTKQANNEWSYEARLDDAFTWNGESNIQFDEHGQTTFGSVSFGAPDGSGSTVALSNGAELPNGITVDLGELTQFGTPSGVTRLNPDGYTAGEFAGLSVEADGRISARYTNGQTQSIGQVALTQFASPDNLKPVGHNSWIETHASGSALRGVPGSSGLGGIEAGALEESNVNISEQLIKMITAQRNYQANAKMISTEDAVTQELLNIR